MEAVKSKIEMAINANLIEDLKPVCMGNNFILNEEGEYLFLNKKDTSMLWLHGDLPEVQPLLIHQEEPEEAATESNEVELAKPVIWSSRHPSVTDKEATSEFLDLMLSDRIQGRMNNKLRMRKTFWREIAAEMKVKGYNLGGEGLADKVNNKYKNLERAYKEFIQHMKKKGEKQKDPPQFYEKLHQLFGEKYNHHPESIIPPSPHDSSNDSQSFQSTTRITNSSKPSTSQLEDFNEEDAVTPSYSNSIGETIILAKSSPKPPQQSHTKLLTKLLEIKEKQQERFRKTQEEQQMHFEVLTDLMDCHHKERQETMKALINAMKDSNCKRKRPCNGYNSD